MIEYFEFRKLIYNACLFDSIPVTEEVRPYLRRVDAGENIFEIVKSYANKVIKKNQTWTVRVEDKVFKVQLTNKLKGELTSKLNPVEGEKIENVAKRVLVCLANLETVLREGRRTKFIKNDNRITASGAIKHKGWSWIYVEDCVEEPGIEGGVLVQINFPGSNIENYKGTAPKNTVYNIASQGTFYYNQRMQQFVENEAIDGEVSIVLDT